MKLIKGIIFDLDGTLLNTLDDIFSSINHVMQINNFPVKSIEEIKKNLGYGSKYLISNLLPNQDSNIIEKITKDYNDYYNINNNIKTKAYNKINDLLKILKEKKLILAITSNKNQEAVIQLNKEQFDNQIDICLGEVKGVPLKPDPTIIQIALNKMCLNLEEVIYIGDTEVDMQTAKNANIRKIAVTWGFRSYDLLKSLEPDYIISDPFEVIKIVE